MVCHERHMGSDNREVYLYAPRNRGNKACRVFLPARRFNSGIRAAKRAMNQEIFADRLKTLRSRRRISRKTLSELCGLSKNQVARYERMERVPTVQSLESLADFFEVSIDYLLGR